MYKFKWVVWMINVAIKAPQIIDLLATDCSDKICLKNIKVM